jgi:hypothetical protein
MKDSNEYTEAVPPCMKDSNEYTEAVTDSGKTLRQMEVQCIIFHETEGPEKEQCSMV